MAVSFSEQEFTLCSALLQASKQGESQAAELKDKQLILNAIQDKLLKIVQSCVAVSINIKQKEQQISGVTNEIEQVCKQIERQQTEMLVFQTENLKLCSSTEEDLECSHFSLSWYNTCRNKMESYKMSTAALENRATIRKKLMEKREEIKRHYEHTAVLKMDLQNTVGNSIQQAQKEIDNFKTQIHKTKQLVRRKEIILEEETKNHSQLKNDIAIHNRKFEAIMKRLCCQQSSV